MVSIIRATGDWNSEVNIIMDIRESIEIIEGKKFGDRVVVKGRSAFIDGVHVGDILGGRFRHKGQITPSSGYYLKLPNGTELFRREGTDKHPWRSGEFSYANDLIRHLSFHPEDILAKVSGSE